MKSKRPTRTSTRSSSRSSTRAGWRTREGRYIDFKNTIIILTSNAAQDVIINMCKDPELMPDAEGLEKAMRAPLTKVFPDALLNRLVGGAVLSDQQGSAARASSSSTCPRVEKRVQENHKVPFTYDDSVPELIAQRCTELERGARMVDALITNTMLPEIGQEMLSRMMEGKPLAPGARGGERRQLCLCV